MRHYLLLLIFTLTGPVQGFGQSHPLPSIQFDVPSVVSCRDVTTEEFANTHSLEKLLEVRVNVSSLLANGTDRCIRELFFFFYSPERSFEVVDFLPQTTLITEFASPIDESRNEENSNSAGFNFSPTFEMAGKASLNANTSDRQGTTLRTSKLPPKQLAVASGTQKRSTAVYFKLKPSSQLTLEGSQEIILSLKVPNAWRADLMHVHCRGVTAWKPDGPQRKSRADFVVPLYLANDAPAKIRCDQLVKSELALRRLAGAAQSPPKPKKKDFASRVSLFVKKEILGKKEKTTVQTNWLGRVIFNNQSVEQIQATTGVRLNPSVLSAVNKFRSSRDHLVKLNH